MNKISITGRLTKSAEVRFTETGKKVVSLIIADNGSDKNKEQNTQFWNISCWKETADFSEGLTKGMQVTVVGVCNQEKNEKNGKTYYNTKVTAFKVKLIAENSNSSKGA